MQQDKKDTIRQLWEMRHLSVAECMEAIKQRPALQFLLTAAGIWFFLSSFLSIFISVHLLYFVYRVFHLVLS